MSPFKLLPYLVFLLSCNYLSAQMYVNSDTLYGNEWINYDQEYVKIAVGQEGIYRLNYQALNDAGVFSGGSTPSGEDFQLIHNGQEVPLYTTTNGSFSGSDFLEFYGETTDGSLDAHLYESPSDHINPKVNMFNDTSAYFLTWDVSSNNNQRVVATSNDISNPPQKEAYCYAFGIKYWNAVYTGKKHTGALQAIFSGFDVTEGVAVAPAFLRNVPVATPKAYQSSGAPNALVKSRFFGQGSGQHHTVVSVASEPYIDTTYTDWIILQADFEIPATELGNTNTTIAFANDATTTDKVGVGYAEIEYPRTFDFSNNSIQRFKLLGSTNQKYLEITNFNHGGIAPVLYDVTNKKRIVSVLENDTVKIILPVSTEDRMLVLTSESDISQTDDLQKKVFIDYSLNPTEYLIVSNKLLFDDGAGNNFVQDYADYRTSSIGGGFNVTVAEVHEVYDQFSYGIDRHEISIRNLVHYLLEVSDLSYVFLIGDGAYYKKVKLNYPDFAHSAMVPTFGYPTSDNLIAASNFSNVPKVPVGRLAAQNPGHVDLYLRKVISFEGNKLLPQTIEEKAWMKRFLHLGGGSPDIQTTIKTELNNVKDIIEASTFGADVYSFFKTSSDVIQEAPSEQIESLINDGVSFISFFGHSAPSTLDFDLDSPDSYNNSAGKYPVIYTIGCHTNRFLEFDETISERWILAEDKGAIAFLGATWETTLSNLSSYAQFFYQNFGTDNYGERLGDIMVSTIQDFDLSSTFYAEQLKQVITLHGDPALIINAHEGPDYLVNTSTVQTAPPLLNSQMESFDLNFVGTNIGSAVGDSITVYVQHELPSGELLPVVELKTSSPGFEKDFISNLSMPTTGSIVGFNKLHIRIDPNDSIPEYPNPVGEMNNDYTYTFYILANDAFPVYPYEYSIVSNNNIKLKASTANVFADEERYFIQIDTTDNFNSSLSQETTIVAGGGLLEWEPNIPLIDSTVYYWRVSIDSSQTVGYGFNWHRSSFIYIDDSPTGWNQSHFFQFTKEDEFTDMVLPSSTRDLSFKVSLNELKVKNSEFLVMPYGEIGAVLNSSSLQPHTNCFQAGVYVVSLDPETLETMINTPLGSGQGSYESYNCKTYDLFHFPYKTDELEEREKLITFLENDIPSNNYVIFYTFQEDGTDYEPEEWALDSLSNSFEKNIFQVLEEQGATKVRQLMNTGSKPYFFVYQKDNPIFLAKQSYNTEYLAETDSMIIEATMFLETLNDRGSIKSTTIGPALSWESLHWNMENFEIGSDEVSLNVYGVSSNNTEALLHHNISVSDTTLNHIEAEQWPYLRLEFTAKDSIFKTSPHLDFWRIVYDPVPEAALRPDLNLSFQSDTLQQGEDLKLGIAIENISEVDMDSLLVRYSVIDQYNNLVLTDSRMAPLLKGDTLNGYLSFDTKNITTPLNQLVVEVNPDNDQLEQSHFNNIGVKQFYIVLDQKNPLLDVTFDGVHILDGDLVSAKPLINIVLKDENSNLPLNDTSLFRIEILYPNETEPRAFLTSDEGVTFYPADADNLDKENKAKFELREFFQEDGIYELSVKAKDRTGNNSGDNDYKIRFEIINEAMVSNVLNYPNPFSTSTQFVFTLTGSEVPDFMKIQIMSVSGKVIKEITDDELGPLHIGKNITQYRWDGTDDFGDRLANGVYLYRVVTREANGDEYKEYNTNTNKYFKNGFGKMVIIR